MPFQHAISFFLQIVVATSEVGSSAARAIIIGGQPSMDALAVKNVYAIHVGRGADIFIVFEGLQADGTVPV